MNYDFEHAEVCPNKEANHQSWQTERNRALHAEKLLIKALGPVRCPECFTAVVFHDNPSLADPCRVILFSCPGCRANFSDFPNVVVTGLSTWRVA